MTTLIHHISWLGPVLEDAAPLRGSELADMPLIRNAWLQIDDDVISGFGSMDDLSRPVSDYQNAVDASGRWVLPAWCDSHTHLVFAGSREGEFVDKIKGLTYADIAARGGGILNSAAKLKNTSEDELFNQSWARLQDVIRMGTGAIEIKTGYGLETEGELKMLRVIKRIKDRSPIPVKATYLAAHALPVEYHGRQEEYIDEVINNILPQVMHEGIAEYIDVFCEKGFFTVDHSRRVLKAGKEFGLKPRIHANQLHVSGGVELGVELGAISVDHLESMDESAITALASSDTIGTLLPTAAFFLRMPFQPARAIIDNGAAVALATDYNPGSSPSGNMNLLTSMACIQMKMLPSEAVQAATFNGACAMELQEKLGSIAVGKLANLIFTKPLASPEFQLYNFGNNLPDAVMINGEWVLKNSAI